MSDPTLGSLIFSSFVERDAVHVAILPVIAGQEFPPGHHVGLAEDGKASADAKPIGIVDPFLHRSVKAGEKFYIALYPQSVTGMRHKWRHPLVDSQDAFSEREPDKKKAVARSVLEVAAKQHGVDLDELLSDMRSFTITGNHRCDGGRWEGMGIYGEAWDAYEILTGKTVSEDDRGSVYTCSC